MKHATHIFASTILAAALLIPSIAHAAGGVRFSYEKVDLAGTTEWVLVPVAVNGLGGKPTATTLKTAFELLRKEKRGSYGASKITVTGAPPRAKATVEIDPAMARYALIVMAESVYTLTELGAESVAFPGHATTPLTRKDIPFSAYSLTVPLWKAAGRFDSASVQVLMPDGTQVPSNEIARKWKANDAGLRAEIYKYLNSPDAYTVQTVAKLLPELKMPFKTQVTALLAHASSGVRATALTVLESERNDAAVLAAVETMLGKEKDAAVGRAAAAFLGKSSNAKFSVLEQYYLLEHGSAAEKTAAVQALAKSKDSRTPAKLAPLLTSNDKALASAAATSLATIGATKELQAALNNNKVNADVRLAIANSLTGSSDASGGVSGFVHVVNNGAEHDAIAALQELGKLRSDAARKAVEGFLASTKPMIRLTAIDVVESIGSADSVSALGAAIKHGRDADKMADTAIRILAKQSVDTILAKTSDSDPTVQRFAYVAISQKSNPGSKAFSALEAGTKSKDPLIRGAAARAIGSYANADAERILKGLVKDSSAVVRADVAHGIGFLKEGRLYDELTALLDDKDASVQGAAALSLGKRGEAGPWNKIKALANSNNEGARAASLTALAALVSRQDAQAVNEVVSLLSGAVTHRSVTVREAALKALGTFTTDTAVTAISLQAGAEEPQIRILAIEALAATKNKSAVGVIADRLLDQNVSVRRAAIVALGDMKAKAQLQRHASNEKDGDLKSLVQDTLKKL